MGILKALYRPQYLDEPAAVGVQSFFLNLQARYNSIFRFKQAYFLFVNFLGSNANVQSMTEHMKANSELRQGPSKQFVLLNSPL
jgi:hypothetical protein